MARPASGGPAAAALYELHYREDLDPIEILRAHREWGRGYDPAPPRPAKRTATPLRIGFVSQDLRGNHPVLFFLRPLLRNLDRGRLDPFLYSATPDPDPQTDRLGSLACLRDIALLSDTAVVELIRADCIDVLVDLTGHLRNNRLPVFAQRPAPVQFSWLAYPNTSGLAAIDFRLSDEIADPLSRGAEQESLDPVCRLPGCFLTYAPPEACPPVSALPALFQMYVTFGVFNNPAKITASALGVWARILDRLPNARLLFHHGFADYDGPAGRDRLRITSTLAGYGIAASRLSFAGARPFEASLSFYSEADISLDTFPYNGATTTCESLWMGLPVVHLSGAAHAGRVTTSLLHAAGMPRYIASSLDEYVELAVELGSDLDALARHRASVRLWMARSPLLDHAAFARNFEHLIAEL